MDRAFTALSAGTDLVLRALAIQGIWVLGTLAGGVVLGWAPATAAATDAAACASRGEPIRLGRAARVWRSSFRRSQITLALPGMFLLLALGATMSTALPSAATLGLGVIAALLLLTMLHIPELDRRYELHPAHVFGAAMRVALAQAPTSLLLLAVLALFAGAVLALPGLAPFLGVSVPLLISHHLVARSLDRNEDLLATRHEPPLEPRPRRARQQASPRRPRFSSTV